MISIIHIYRPYGIHTKQGSIWFCNKNSKYISNTTNSRHDAGNINKHNVVLQTNPSSSTVIVIPGFYSKTKYSSYV
jgi:hypothetical protein